MHDEGDLRTSIKSVSHPSKLSLPKKGYIPPRKKTKGNNEVGERS